MEESGIKYGRERILLSAEDKRGEINLLDFLHHIKSVTSREVAMEDFWPTFQHLGHSVLD